jgi:Uma2 family endonuclease
LKTPKLSALSVLLKDNHYANVKVNPIHSPEVERMVSHLPLHSTSEIIYPDSDGKPMADNTEQFRWIVTIKENLEWLFANDPQVFIAGDLLWYPVEGRREICTAPDTMVVFGRPKGKRGSYKQWEEDNIAPQVVFEILSPGNTKAEMNRKLLFYYTYGVEEYYLYDPDNNVLNSWQRQEDYLEVIEPMENWISPRLGIRFEMSGTELQLYAPDGQRFQSFSEVSQRLEQLEQQAEAERQRADEQQQRAEQLAEKLRALGVNPDEL